MSLLDNSAFLLAFLIACSAKTTILLALAWVTVGAARHRSSALRHFAWAVGILGSLTLPLLSLLLPAWHSAALGNAVGVWGPAHAIASGPSSLTLPSMIVDAGAVSPLFGKLAGLALLGLGSRLFVLCDEAHRGPRASCMDIRARKALVRRWMDTHCSGAI